MGAAIDLSGRRVLVTGAGAGVGRAIAMAFGSAGAAVVVNDVDPDRGALVADAIAGLGGEASVSCFDVADYAAVSAAVAAGGPVDVLVNNAGNAGVEGFGARGAFARSEPADWEPFLRVNLYGALHCCRVVLPGMIDAGWGRLITIVSDAARTGDAGGAAYGAAKAGAAGLTRSVALENARFGVTANNIALGTMRTEATEGIWAEPDNPVAERILARYPIARPGQPDDVVHLAVYLASSHASWITGQTYALNGGYSFTL